MFEHKFLPVFVQIYIP